MRVVRVRSDDLPRRRSAVVDLHYLTLADGRPTLDEFVEYLKTELVYFCLPRSHRQNTLELIAADPNKAYGLIGTDLERAKSLFLRDENDRSGECGELALFVFLEWALKAPQVLAKMSLKTNPNMPIHGTDGIHIGYDDVEHVLIVYWGESKVYQSFASGLAAAAKTIGDFVSSQERQKHELQLLQDYMDVGEGNLELRHSLLQYLNPYTRERLNRREIFACLLCYDEKDYEQLSSLPPEGLEDRFRRLLSDAFQPMCNLVSRTIDESPLVDHRFHFFLLPVRSVMELRQAFSHAIRG